MWKLNSWIKSFSHVLCIFMFSVFSCSLYFPVLCIFIFHCRSHISRSLVRNFTDCPAFNWDMHLSLLVVSHRMPWCYMLVCLFQQYFSYIALIILLVEETGGPGDIQRPVASHWQTLNVHLALIEIRSHYIFCDRHWLHR